jgi:hypothetical protein
MDGDTEKLSEDLDMILKEPYLGLVQQLVGSPTASLSLPELEARNPDVPGSTLSRRLDALVSRERPLVIKLRPNVESPPEGYPQVYFAASERAVELLKLIGLFRGCYRLMMLYQRANLQHPHRDERDVTIDDIEEYEHRPIPDWASEPQTE